MPLSVTISILILTVAGVLFTASVLIKEACHAVNDTNAVFITSISFSIAQYVKKFYAARESCLQQNGRGLTDFVMDMGVNASMLNISAVASPLLNNFNISALPGIDSR